MPETSPASLFGTAMTTLRFNKPYQVLTQFTDAGSDAKDRQTLADYIAVPDVYAAGRLDRDSEGLLLLTSDGQLQNRISHPDHKLKKTYWVQVDGDITEDAVAKLRRGVELKDGMTSPASAKIISQPASLWPRDPPVRFRAEIPTSWLELEISEGRNRQVRRMTAAVGSPTLRLIRYAIGPITLDGLKSGRFEEIDGEQLWSLFPGKGSKQLFSRQNSRNRRRK
ncbi:MAG TPA: pseudouridine synthase [Mariprofundaceae bacterium]|nr:pseudouridine synthase [Mariprofundaceae bacterium]